MVGLVETLTVGQVETLSNLHFFFIKKAILDFLTSLSRLSKYHYNIPRACLLNRSPVPAMDLKSNSQAYDVTC